VWSTKNRIKFLNEEIRKTVFNHIIDNAKQKKIYIVQIGGYSDHVHCLISLNSQQSVSQVAQLLKGESSNWINNNKLTSFPFGWQDEYSVFSVNYDNLKELKEYIQNQSLHHLKKTFEEELNDFYKENGIHF
jgi:REP element-mobilizing transposase RayT